MKEIFGFDGRYRVTLANGAALRCLVCSAEEFAKRTIKLNTTGMSFMGLDFANVASQGLVCLECGHLTEFANNTVTLDR
jgi:predicted nucleic-acid-binding Zn-ribbon protein